MNMKYCNYSRIPIMEVWHHDAYYTNTAGENEAGLISFALPM